MMAQALAAGDYALACAQLSAAALREGAMDAGPSGGP